MSYQQFLKDNKIPESFINRLTYTMKDVVHFLDDSLYINESRTHGKGIFTKQILVKGKELLMYTRTNLRTLLGRYVNHSDKANCWVKESSDGAIYLITKRNINAHEELTVNYYDVIKIPKLKI